MGHREQAIHIAQQMLEHHPLYLDAETTGTESLDEVIEIAVLDWDGAVLLDTLVKPKRSISAGALRVHGISDAQVAFSPPWSEVWPQLQQAIKGRDVGIYNAAFDQRLIRQSCGLNGISWLEPYSSLFCIMELFAQYYGEPNPLYGGYRWKSLDFAGRYLQVPLQNSHRAKDDTMLARLVLHKIAEEK
jgi:DNA polymerase-3 subunit epsilon